MGRELSLREIQLISLEICKKVDMICNENNFRYYLYGGSLLGAVRHKGFIPWDDDIDIVMPRPDYEKFLAYMQENQEKIKPLKLYSFENNAKYPYMISRVSDERYILDVENEDDYGIGIFIDVYPWDGVGQTEEEVAERKGKAARNSSLFYLSTRQKCVKGNTKSIKKLLIKPAAFVVAKVLGKNYFEKKLSKMATKYKYDESRYVGCLVWGIDGVRGIYPIEWMEPYTKLQFEDAQFRVPKEWEKALSKLFRNYMELPPKKDRVPHHGYRAFER